MYLNRKKENKGIYQQLKTRNDHHADDGHDSADGNT